MPVRILMICPGGGVGDVPMVNLVERIARAIRKRQFTRAKSLFFYDPAVVPTDNELDDARVALAEIRAADLERNT